MAFDANQMIVNVRQYHVTCGGGLSGPIIATSETHDLRVRDQMRKSITCEMNEYFTNMLYPLY